MEQQAKPQQPAESLDETITLQGEVVTIHELTYVEAVKATALARPILDQLKGFIEGGQLETGNLEIILAEHADNWMELLALATGREIEWIAQLSDTDGLCLMMAFWRVNGNLFIRRLMLGDALQFSLNDLWGRLLPQRPTMLQ